MVTDVSPDVAVPAVENLSIQFNGESRYEAFNQRELIDYLSTVQCYLLIYGLLCSCNSRYELLCIFILNI